jgi:hypothetical protein
MMQVRQFEVLGKRCTSCHRHLDKDIAVWAGRVGEPGDEGGAIPYD